MAERRLRISDDLSLPLEAVTEPLGILAARRAGKSNAAVVIAEQMFDAGLHWVAIDPKGDWWGVRSAGDGKKPGLPVPIFGGSHGDIPLEPGAGHLIADLIVDQRLTCILDVSGFASEADKIRFLLAFGDRLFRRKEQGQEPTHVFFEEADDYAPQRVFPEQARLVHVMARILKQGGARGLGGTVISQRSAVVHKDLLSQIQTLFALRTTGPQDRKAIKDWVSFTGENAEIVADLPGLADGEAWVWSPNWLRTTQRIRFHRRRTFDSGATPAVGASRRPAATLSDVDLGVLQERMAATIEKAEAADPVKLQARIRVLERELSSKDLPVATEPEIVEVPVLNGEVEKLEQVLDRFSHIGSSLSQTAITLGQIGSDLVDVAADVSAKLERAQQAPRAPVAVQRRTVPPPPPAAVTPVSAPRPPRDREVDAGDVRIGKAERAILTALQLYPTGLTRTQLAFLAGYHQRAKSYTNALGGLRSSGLIGPDFPAVATDAGLELDVGVKHTAGDLVEFWIGRLGRAERAIVEHLVDIYPAAADREELVRLAGYEHVRTKSFTNALGRVRGLGLVDGFALHADFAALTARR